MATVVCANRKPGDLGGHIASFASSATLHDVGFNHFWRAPSPQHPGDLLYIQGHSSPGIYARAFLEGRISESQLDHFRMEVDGKGISSYPPPLADAAILADTHRINGPGSTELPSTKPNS